MDGKKWYESKIIWTNFIAIIGDVLMHVTGHTLPAGVDLAILAVINAILRAITKDPIVW